MSLRPQEVPLVPEETVRVALAAFPKGSICMHLRDAVGAIYTDQDFTALFPVRGQPAAAPWRLALVSVLQFVEGLSDRQTADAVRGFCQDSEHKGSRAASAVGTLQGNAGD